MGENTCNDITGYIAAEYSMNVLPIVMAGLCILLAQSFGYYSKWPHSALEAPVRLLGAMQSSLSSVMQLFLHHEKRNLVVLQEILHGYHFVRASPTAVTVIIRIHISEIRGSSILTIFAILTAIQVPRCNGIPSASRLRFVTAIKVQFADHPIEHLFDNNAGHIEQTIDAAATQYKETKVT